MKKILNHLRKDWYKYALEMIVITFGILGAYALNNWNEGRKDEVRAVKFLQTLSEDLQSVHFKLDSIIVQENEFKDFLVSYLKEKKTTDSLAALPATESAIFDLLYNADITSQELTSYVDFAEIENLNLIASEQIRNGLKSLENEFFHLNEITGDRLTVQQLRGDKILLEEINFLPLLKKRFNVSSIMDSNSVKTYQELLQNQQFRNLIGLKLGITIQLIGELEKTKRSVYDLTEVVDKGIEKKQ